MKRIRHWNRRMRSSDATRSEEAERHVLCPLIFHRWESMLVNWSTLIGRPVTYATNTLVVVLVYFSVKYPKQDLDGVNCELEVKGVSSEGDTYTKKNGESGKEKSIKNEELIHNNSKNELRMLFYIVLIVFFLESYLQKCLLPYNEHFICYFLKWIYYSISDNLTISKSHSRV